MTINPATVGVDAYVLLDGSVSSFYAQVDEAIVASEVVKGQYRMTINPAYNAPNPDQTESLHLHHKLKKLQNLTSKNVYQSFHVSETLTYLLSLVNLTNYHQMLIGNSFQNKKIKKSKHSKPNSKILNKNLKKSNYSKANLNFHQSQRNQKNSNEISLKLPEMVIFQVYNGLLRKKVSMFMKHI